MRFVHIAYSCLIILSLATISTCHVLVAGNEDAFRSLAKNYVPKALAEKLVNLVSQASQANRNEEEEEAQEEYTNLRADQADNQAEGQHEGQIEGQVEGQSEQAELVEQGDQTQPQQEEQAAADENREYENPENNEQLYQVQDKEQYEEAQANLRVKPEMNQNKPRQMEVNLDELVEKVRERLLDELKTAKSEPRNTPVDDQPQMIQPRIRPPEQDYKQNIKNSQPTSEPKHLYKTKKEKAGVVIETGDLYDKVKLTRSKNKKKDSYEDYAKNLPKKDYDIFESEEESTKPKEVKKEERPKPKLKMQVKKTNSKSKSTNLPYRNENSEEVNVNVYKDSPGNDINSNKNINKAKKGIPKRTTPSTTNNDQITNPSDYSDSDMQSPKIIPQTTSQLPNTTTPEEYVDDGLIAPSTDEILPKAATEYIGGVDYYKDDSPGTGRTTEEPAQYPKKKKHEQKKIVTNMQIRLRYTLPTPEVYGKLPRVAEKYNFEEPIPEQDREKEVPKQIGPPPAIINGNVKVKSR